LERKKRKIAIIGGGLRGLTAAYEIDKAIRQHQLPFEYMIIEERASVGGMIKTIEMDGFSIDVGAASFDVRRADIRDFLQELGLCEDIQFNIGHTMALFDGSEFISSSIPTYHGLPLFLSDIWREGALSLGLKMQTMLNGLFVIKNLHEDTRYSAENFLEFRTGREFVDYIAEPFYPENIYGSMELIPVKQFDKNLVTLYTKSGNKLKANDLIRNYADGPGKEYGLKNGMATLVAKLLEKVEGHVYLNQKVTELEVRGQESILLELNGHESLLMDSVVVATNPQETHGYMKKAVADLAFPEPTSSSMGTVLFLLDRETIANMPDGHGFVIPRKSTYHITKTTILNNKWLSFEKGPHLYLLVEFGRRQEETLIKLTDEKIIAILKKELKEILQLTAEPRSSKVYRWENAIPHFSLEQRRNMLAADYELNKAYAEKGIILGGNGLKGYDMATAIAEGKQMADEVITYMQQTENNHPQSVDSDA